MTMRRLLAAVLALAVPASAAQRAAPVLSATTVVPSLVVQGPPRLIEAAVSTAEQPAPVPALRTAQTLSDVASGAGPANESLGQGVYETAFDGAGRASGGSPAAFAAAVPPLPRASRASGLRARARTAALSALAVLPALVNAPNAASVRAWLGLAGFAAGAWMGREAARGLLEPLSSKPGAHAAALLMAVIAAGTLVGVAAAVVAGWSAVAAGLGLFVAAFALGAATGRLGWLAPGAREPAFLRVVERNGSRFLELRPEDLGRPFLVAGTLERGLGEKDFYSSRSDGMEFLGALRRVGDHVELVSKNTRFRAADGTPMQRALAQAVPDTALSRARIAGLRGGRLLVSADELFARDLFDWQPDLASAYEGEYALDAAASRVEDARAYPRNVELTTRLSFVRTWLDARPQTHLNDARNLPMLLRLSISELPRSGYRPRAADERVGFFASVFQDWTDDQKPTLDRRLIHRWRLEKTDPAAEVSPVKEPIVYWIDGNVPKEYRGVIEKAVLTWNKAFERVGLKGAIVVKQAPDGEAFDPTDASRNVIRYYLESDSGFAIGPSRADPMTGQLYHAGVAISAYHARNPLAAGVPAIDLQSHAEDEAPAGRHLCRYGQQRAREASLALTLLEARGGLTEEQRRQFIQDYMTDLVLHELGHTLGLRHNFTAKAWRPNAELGDHAQFVASVMDYAPVNLAPPGQKQGAFWTTDLGPYDYWAIEYGYKPLPPETEKEELSRIAARSSQPELRFMTDEDSNGLDPTAQPWTLGQDALDYARGRAAIVRELWGHLEARVRDSKSSPPQDLYRGLLQGWAAYRQAAIVAARFVGGVQYRRGASPAYETVPIAQQRRALDFLGEEVFADEPLAISAELLAAVSPDRLPTVADDYPELTLLPYNRLALWVRRGALARLLSPRVLRRVVETGNLVPRGEERFTVAELFNRLTGSIWSELRPKGRFPNKARGLSVTRRELQEDYLARLIEIAYPASEEEVLEVSTVAKSHLQRLRHRLLVAAESPRWDQATRDHFRECAVRIHAVNPARDR